MRITCIAAALLAAACGGGEAHAPITVFGAASLARPLAALADSFQQRERVPVLRELGGSLEHARKLTELNRVPDVLLLADDNVVAALMPTHLDWYVRFATNRLVIAFMPASRYADSITTANWWRVLSRPGVTVGRADPEIAPAGRHAVGLLQRAETYYRRPGLDDTLLARASLRFMRPNATELAALLETGEVDYILDYESVARQYGFRFVQLPEDLAPPVLYGISVPRQAPHPADGIRFVTYVLSERGKQVLRAANVTVLRVPVALGANVPPEISELVRTLAAAAAN